MRKLLVAATVAVAVMVLGSTGGARAAERESPRWPTLREQMQRDRVERGTELEKLISENQDFTLLDPREAQDRLGVPLWLRVHWRKAHPELRYDFRDPTHGYPLVLKEVAEWMKTHPNFDQSRVEPELETKTYAAGANVRLSGAQSNPRSESDIRVNYWNTSKVLGASNNLGGSGQQAQWFSSDGGASWSQSSLPLASGDSFHSDPTVDWTSDGTAWSTTIGINSAGTVLKMRAYRSTDGGATWTLDNTFSGTQSSADKQMMWTDHSATSSFKDSIYAIWHNGNPVFFNRRRAGSWLASPVQISGSETTGTGIGADIKTNSAGEVFAMWPDTGSSKLYLTKSTDGGGTWGARTTVATTFDSFDIGVPAFNNRRMLIYVAVGTYKAGTKNNVYTVWNDLSGASGCTAPANEPGSSATSSCKTRIWFARSTDGGATWGAKVKINDQSGLNDQFNPWLAVDETNGKIAVMYYDTVNDAGRKKVDVYYQSSSNDGSTWSTPLKVTTATTDETAAGADSGNQFGDYNSLSGISGGFFPSWTDRRSGAKEEIWSAKVTDDGGAVNNPPTANFTFTTSGLTASFTDTSTDSDGTIASRSWAFGDATTSTATNPSHTYAAASTYTVSLTVTDNGGATNSTSKSVTVAATCTPPAAPTGVTATAASATQINVAWTASAGATSYTILRSTTSGGPYSSVGTSTTTSFSDTTASCNTTYFYVVTASNGTCSSGNSAQASATTNACAGNVLTKDVPVTGISGATGNDQFWTMSVPAGATNLKFTTSGGTGDVDLYVRFGSPPTTTTNDCKSEGSTTAETCAIAAPSAGTYHVLLHAFATYSGVSLVGTYTTGGGGTELISNGGFESGVPPWTQSGSAIRSTGAFPHSGTAYSLIGGTDNSTGAEFQQISIPSTATGTLTFWLNVSSNETTTTTQFDVFFVEVRDSAGALLSTLGTFSNLNKTTAGNYSQKTFSVSAFKGQTVRIQFRGTADSSLTTTFRVDDVSVK